VGRAQPAKEEAEGTLHELRPKSPVFDGKVEKEEIVNL